MRTIRTKLYFFNELSAEAQQKAIQDNSDINTSHKWWETVYEDAERAGLKITSFDLYQNNRVDAHFIVNAIDCATKILAEHGEDCKSYLFSALYIKHYNVISVLEDNDDNINELNEHFLKDVCNYYGELLHQDLEYRESKEAIKDALISNEYEFTANGNIFNS